MMKVSICMITYNHEHYIREAINGVLMQKTNFDFELIIADDHSEDDTNRIIRTLLHDHPQAYRIKYFRHNENMGAMPNFIFALQQCKGEYVALCEGDDYWTDREKLQKQVDLLESNEEYTLCFHRVETVFPNGEKGKNTNPPRECLKSEYSIFDLIDRNFIDTCSVMYRWKFYDSPLPEWYADHIIGDYSLHFLHAMKGKIVMLPEVMATHRILSGGLWLVISREMSIERLEDLIKIYNDINNYSGGKYRFKIEQRIHVLEKNLIHGCINNGCVKKSMELYGKMKAKMAAKEKIRFYGHYLFPSLYSLLKMLRIQKCERLTRIWKMDSGEG